jgi:dihydroxyacetone kinase-like predicted kinase
MPEPVQPPVERRRRVLSTLDAGGFLRWAAVARSSFASARAEIDALNVFPVPDGDTGTNLYLTLDAALDAARTAISRDIPIGSVTMPSLQVMCREMSRAMLLTARGNSGVILSQLFRGFAEHVVDTGSESLDGAGLAGAFARADHLAWRAVTEPKEGTILSVSRAVATVLRARADAQPGMPLADAISLAASTAAEALERTPSQLPALARAGVVDAGGAGYLLLIEALARVIQGQPPQADDDPFASTPGLVPAGRARPGTRGGQRRRWR